MLLNDITPLKFDCGVLCNKACCKGDKNTGMYLYPGEELMYMSSLGPLNISEINPSEEYDKKYYMQCAEENVIEASGRLPAAYFLLYHILKLTAH